MASFTDLSSIAKDSGFQGRVGYALYVAGVAILAEDPTTAHHSVRVDYARKVVGGGQDLLSASLAVLTNPSIAAEANISQTPLFNVPDGDIQFTVNSLVNALAGIGS